MGYKWKERHTDSKGKPISFDGLELALTPHVLGGGQGMYLEICNAVPTNDAQARDSKLGRLQTYLEQNNLEVIPFIPNTANYEPNPQKEGVVSFALHFPSGVPVSPAIDQVSALIAKANEVPWPELIGSVRIISPSPGRGPYDTY